MLLSDTERFRAQPLTLIGDSPKGPTYRFSSAATPEAMCGLRHAGAVFGRHYHKGLSRYKSPEQFVLLQGEIELWLVDVRTGEQGRARFSAPHALFVYPHIWHQLSAVTQVVFVEMNPLDEHARDTFYDFEPPEPA